MAFPEVTHLQFKVLASLATGELSGRDLRKAIAEEGLSQTRASFYQLMSRLEDAGFVEGRYEQTTIDEMTVTERCYQLAAAGRKVLDDALIFYSQALHSKIAFGN